MSREPYVCRLDPDTNTTVKIYLFKNVQNIEEVRNSIIKGTWKCAAIKPGLILDVFQVAVAANKAVLAEKSNSMVTRTVYAEILYNLSLTKNITQSLSKFGVEKDNNLLICVLVKDKDDSNNVIEHIKGELCPINELQQFTDMKNLKSVYKFNNVKGDIDLLDVIVSRMVTKSFVSY